ncbi:MAG TPA: SHOCT domain-containing protein [Anaerolineales bacterium]|nr:SHOCT domain-containing protein [Anaerolineales bacterium]
MDLFIVFVFPLVAAPILSGAALLIAKLFTVPIVRWVVVFGLGVIAPVSLYLLALVGHWIARMLYMGNKASIPSVPFGRTAVMIMPNLAMVGTSVEQKMEQLKEMLDKDLISFNDYERKKADILANM